MEKNTYSVSLAKRQLVDSIWKSAGIEGLGTTFPNTEKILENLPVETKRDEVLFIVNMKRAWYFLLDNLDYPNNLMFLSELNKVSMDGLLYDAGAVRTGVVTIGGSSYVPEIPHEGIVAEELKRLSEYEDKTEQALDTFCYIARTQIFTDGNKRLAQLMCNKILIENDLGIFSIPYDKIGRFKELLVNFYEQNDNTKIKSFFKEFCLIRNPSKDINPQKIDEPTRYKYLDAESGLMDKGFDTLCEEMKAKGFDFCVNSMNHIIITNDDRISPYLSLKGINFTKITKENEKILDCKYNQ